MNEERKRAEASLAYAEMSLAMEGLHFDDEGKNWCRKLLLGEITFEDYLNYAKRKVGATSV